MVQAGAVVDVPDVHTGTLANRVEPFEHRDARAVVIRRGRRNTLRASHVRHWQISPPKYPCGDPRLIVGASPTIDLLGTSGQKKYTSKGLLTQAKGALLLA